MKTSIGRRSVSDEKLSRRLELVGKLRSVSDKAPRRFRIGVADDLFAGHHCVSAKQPIQTQVNESKTVSTPESESRVGTGFSQTDLAVGLAAIAGLALGYLIGRRGK